MDESHKHCAKREKKTEKRGDMCSIVSYSQKSSLWWNRWSPRAKDKDGGFNCDKGHDGNILPIDYGSGYTGVYICQSI